MPHGPLVQLEENLWLVEGETRMKALGRKMVVARNGDSLFVHNAIMLDDATFKMLDALGRVKTIFVPNRFHDMDAGRMHARYPDAVLAALPKTRARLSKKFPRLIDLAPAHLIESVKIRAIAGLRDDENVMEIAHGGRVTQVYTDALFNLPDMPGMGGLFLRLVGSSGGFKMTRIGRLFTLADRNAFRAFLEEQSRRDDLVRVIVAHGRTVTSPKEALGQAAMGLM